MLHIWVLHVFYINSLIHVLNFIVSTVLRILSAGYFIGEEELTDFSHLLGKEYEINYGKP